MIQIWFRYCFIVAFFLWSLLLIAETRINDIQFLATHNSFKQYLDPNLSSIIESICNLTDISLDDYQHLPLPQQLDLGVRGVELDVFADPEGGRYRKYVFLSLIGESSASNDPSLDVPGFKVMHDVNFDFHSTCHLFANCLDELWQWSRVHPNHLPIFVHVQVRDEPTPVIGKYLDIIGLPVPLPATLEVMDSLDAEIRKAIPINQIITPDQVRGRFANLRSAVLANNWPTLAASRGKFVFYMDARTDVQELYVQGHPQLSGRVIFTSPSDENADDAAFIIINDPVVDGQRIKQLVSQGFIVRSRADSGTVEAYKNDKSTWQSALQSGAQIVSTDFIRPDPKTRTDYFVFIPNGNPARCSPLRQNFCDEGLIGE